MTPSPVPQAVPAWFGKLASLGDFASRRLPQDLVQALDVWLSAGLNASRSLLADRWMNTYLSSPLWRFAMAPGALDGQWWFGVMMPSVDSVGRYFPLLVMHPQTDAPADLSDLSRLEAWWSEVAVATLGTLQAGGSLQSFESALAQTTPLQLGTERRAWTTTQRQDRVRHEGAEDATLPDALAQFAVAECVHQLRGCSLWSSLRPGVACNSFSRTAGLPKAESLARLLDGTWGGARA